MLRIIGNKFFSTLTTLWKHHRVIGVYIGEETVFFYTADEDYWDDITRCCEKYRISVFYHNFGEKKSQKCSTLLEEIKGTYERGFLFLMNKRERKRFQKVLKKLSKRGYKISLSTANGWRFVLR